MWYHDIVGRELVTRMEDLASEGIHTCLGDPDGLFAVRGVCRERAGDDVLPGEADRQ